MIPTQTEVRQAIVAALTTGAGAAALEAAGVADADQGGVVTGAVPDGLARPYVEVQSGTVVEAGRSDQTRAATVTVTSVVRADTLAEAEAVAEAVVSTVAVRLSGTGYDLTAATLDLYGPALREPPPGARPWSLPVRTRYTLYQTADPGE